MTPRQPVLATVVSYAMHPLLLPAYFMLVLFNLESFIAYMYSFPAKMVIMAQVVLTTCIFPMMFMYLFKRKGIIASYQLHTREERVYPFVVTAMFFFVNYYLLRQVDFSSLLIFRVFMLGATCLIIIALLINFRWKISIHMMGVGGFLGALFALNLRLTVPIHVLLASIILIGGATGYARLRINAHNPPQVYAGFLIGTAVMIACFLAF